MSVTPYILKFPQEILEYICSYLSREDLRNVAQCTKLLRSSAQQALFRTIYLKLNLTSLENLTTISEHEVLRTYIRRIKYDSRYIYDVLDMGDLRVG